MKLVESGYENPEILTDPSSAISLAKAKRRMELICPKGQATTAWGYDNNGARSDLNEPGIAYDD